MFASARRFFKIGVAIAVLGCAFPAFGNDPLDDAIRKLSTVKTFAFGGIGFAGVTSEGEINFRIVASQERSVALKSFEAVYNAGNAEAKLYALSGIRWLDPARFRALVKNSAPLEEEVNLQNGCILSRERYREILNGIDQGRYVVWVRRDFEMAKANH